MSRKIACLILLSHIGAFLPNDVIRKTAFLDGDFIIGALFPIHSPPTSDGNPLECGPMLRNEGVELVEAAFFAIDSINNNESFLPGIKLGISIKDDCENEQVALYQTMQMLKAPNSSDNILDLSSPILCPNESSENPLIGMMGTMTKLNMLHYENLLKLFKIPQIGYSTSLSELVSPYFYLSVVPSDYHLAYLIIKILKKYNWNYISVAYNDEYFGMNGKYFLEQWVSHHNICISNSIHIPRPKQNIMYVQSEKYLFLNEKAKVIVCFCDEDTLKNIFNVINEFNLTGQYFVLSSNEWPLWEDQFKGYEKEAEGMLMLTPRNKLVNGFQTYVSSLRPGYNRRNPWYEEYVKIGLPPLTDQNTKIAYVVKSIHTFAHGLRQMYFNVCESRTKECLEKEFDTTVYMEYLANVSFEFDGEEVEFQFNGSPRIGKFDVYNFQKTSSDSYKFVDIGDYDCHHENITEDNYVLHLNISGEIKYPKDKKIISICSDECPSGHAQVNDKELQCCWQCLPCNETAYLVDKFNCKECPKNHLPNKNKTDCTEAPLKYEKWNNPRSLIAMGASGIIITLALTTAKIFVKNRHTPVVKSSSPPLHYIMLCGVTALSSINFILVIKPNYVVCILAKTIPSLAISMIYIPVIFKTLQLYYVLKAMKNRNSKFPLVIRSFKIQATIIGIMIVLEAVIMIGWAIIQEEPIYERTYQKEQTVELLRCVFKKKHWLDILFVVMHLIMIYYGIKIKKISHNFHEAKFLAMYTFVQSSTTLAFRIVYNSSDFQTVSMSMGFSLNSFITLLFLFFPKLYIIIWRPQSNTDDNFKSVITLYYSYNQ